MDLSLYDSKTLSEEGTWFVPSWKGELLDCSFLILGPDSTEAVKLFDEEVKESQRRLIDGLAGQNKGKKESIEEIDTSEDKEVKKAISVIKTWKNIQWEGKELPYSIDNAKFLMRKTAFLREQILRYHQDRVNFTKSG